MKAVNNNGPFGAIFKLGDRLFYIANFDVIFFADVYQSILMKIGNILIYCQPEQRGNQY